MCLKVVVEKWFTHQRLTLPTTDTGENPGPSTAVMHPTVSTAQMAELTQEEGLVGPPIGLIGLTLKEEVILSNSTIKPTKLICVHG